MKTGKINTLKFFSAVLVTVLSFSNFLTLQAASNARSEQAHQAALKALSERLKSDLANGEVNVKFSEVNQYNVSKSRLGIKGSGICNGCSEAEEVAISFDVKIDTTNFKAADVVYSFADAALAAPMLEEAVTQKLLKQIATDYKTANVVIALDSFDVQNNQPGSKQLQGTGEVRIGDIEWYKITVNAVLDSKGAIAGIKYQIQD